MHCQGQAVHAIEGGGLQENLPLLQVAVGMFPGSAAGKGGHGALCRVLPLADLEVACSTYVFTSGTNPKP